jgi:hypothetical protein
MFRPGRAPRASRARGTRQAAPRAGGKRKRKGKAGRPSHATFLDRTLLSVHKMCAEVAKYSASPTGHMYVDDYLRCGPIATDVSTATGGARPSVSAAQR